MTITDPITYTTIADLDGCPADDCPLKKFCDHMNSTPPERIGDPPCVNYGKDDLIEDILSSLHGRAADRAEYYSQKWADEAKRKASAQKAAQTRKRKAAEIRSKVYGAIADFILNAFKASGSNDGFLIAAIVQREQKAGLRIFMHRYRMDKTIPIPETGEDWGNLVAKWKEERKAEVARDAAALAECLKGFFK